MLFDNTIRSPNWELFYTGEPLLLSSENELRIAVIGTRQPTPRIVDATREVAEYLVKNDVVIVSGLAIGVDTIAHTTTIQAGGRTIAVPGSPLNNIYPPSNKSLVGEIVASGGCVATPFQPGTAISKSLFPTRNRIIARLSHAIVITGIAPISGTFHVVWEANRLGIPVFAIPTDPKDRLCGTNLLIGKGVAIPLVDFGEILEKAEEVVQKISPTT